jgi:hypothetical protein
VLHVPTVGELMPTERIYSNWEEVSPATSVGKPC